MAIRTINAPISVTETSGPEFSKGDRYTFRFSFDDTTQDSKQETYNANFTDGLIEASLVKEQSYAQIYGLTPGSWDPS